LRRAIPRARAVVISTIAILAIMIGLAILLLPI
jgi:hypothetical protein